MPAKKKPSPQPIPTFVVCSLCGEPWASHEEVDGEVSTLECIRLLKAKRYSATIIGSGQIVQRPWVQPYNPWPYTVTYTSDSAGNINQASAMTPTIAVANAAA